MGQPHLHITSARQARTSWNIAIGNILYSLRPFLSEVEIGGWLSVPKTNTSKAFLEACEALSYCCRIFLSMSDMN